MRIFYSSKFLRSFAKLPADLQNDFRLKEIIFKADPFDPRIKTHKLKDKDEWSFLITYKVRVIFIFKKDVVNLINIGDHSIYRKGN
ncbi:MAG: hypothetical protein A3G49_04790 [Candidatus Sungbacteria bacterium RIFCSPLOWO2_12_FULL_41_11]|uniref:Addiction module toxin RelE n=1 Tax=Candidatus Sungbacteria bacterium RIFCSPLOWO2_12_FULL_41_11 TaxID=1802286 RepID=A0A1G2LN44_9BACT|nr:MAG: hypothetical protein UV01_C0004G0008 [Parcubacteria group bacterium GW2011_GWA2_42_14]OGZ99627.1 MAG: hypothetical protein A3D41_05760 [Candidatus Sungbacteria bacterium RIFCSPHIGHO2_02_FULL_41_12b]OHA13025.1 MAG: hypothetical protein A3G49_04790 [Candidatus Sungbacteria bacterium RIFCSPLOWO2_12_FULL_41_11]